MGSVELVIDYYRSVVALNSTLLAMPDSAAIWMPSDNDRGNNHLAATPTMLMLRLNVLLLRGCVARIKLDPTLVSRVS